MDILPSDLDIVARTIWGEARSEGYTGKLAVAHVFVNRWRTTTGQFAKDDTLASTALRHLQFSVWTQSDPNFKKMHEVGYGDPYLRASLAAVLEAIDAMDDFTDGALHYHTRNVSPVWSQGHTPCYETAGHLFFNTVD